MSAADSSDVTAFEPGDWPAGRRVAGPMLEPPHALPEGDATEWIPLLPHQRVGEPPRGGRNAGWARIGWVPSALIVDFAFAATSAHNRARRLNERTHLLGDVGEIFLQCVGSDDYVEVHVTPENQRLQLAWSGDRLEAVRNGRAALEDFMVPDPDWVRAVTRVAPTFWSARTWVPVATLASSRRELDADTLLLAAVSRYDVSGGMPPVLSATANFRGQPFHTRAAWHRVRLLP